MAADEERPAAGVPKDGEHPQEIVYSEERNDI